jgi:hypothetical protein
MRAGQSISSELQKNTLWLKCFVHGLDAITNCVLKIPIDLKEFIMLSQGTGRPVLSN